MPGAPEQYMGTFGHEIPGTQHRIVHPGTGRDLPDGAESEVLVRGYNLMGGPYKPEASEYSTPTAGTAPAKGPLPRRVVLFTRRQTDLIKAIGSNVAPTEVEQA